MNNRINNKNCKDNKIKIMSPAGSWESLNSAILAGANEVYFGTKLLNMRANAKNFELNELKKVVELCHKNNVKANLTLNTIIYDDELSLLDKILDSAKKANIDAIIAWDYSIISKCKNLNIPIHISTQASISNFESLKFYSSLGVERVVLARELSLEKIKNIKKKAIEEKINVEIECFCHGAMCVAESGRCFTSQFLYNRSANRGDCLQPCRRKYNVIDPETKKELSLENHYIMSPKDLCTIMIIDKLIESGINVLKIEGRNRPPEYVNTVTKVYKKAIELYYNNKLTIEIKESLLKELELVYNRKYHTGFYLGTPTSDDFTNLYGSNSTKKKTFIGQVKKVYNKINVFELEINSESLSKNDSILITGKTTGSFETEIHSIRNAQEKEISLAKKGETVGIKIKSEKKVRIKDKIFLYN